CAERWDTLRRCDDLAREWPGWSNEQRGRDRRAQAILLRRAGPCVDPEHLAMRPAPAFAPEDIPARPDRNAAWFRVMAGASRPLAGAGELEAGLSTFVARHHRAVLAEARRCAPRWDVEDEPGGDVQRLVRRLLRFARATGRRPGRRSNPTRCLAEARRWAAHDANSDDPAARLGALLERVRTLELGEVIAVRELGAPFAWGEVAGLALPPWPHADVAVDGVTVTPMTTAVELAAEGARMQHCAAAFVPDVVAGDLYVFAVRAGPSRLTSAVRPLRAGGYELVEVRGQANRAPTRAERDAVTRWLEAVNDRT
ncbi:MAG TPA: PcfJ domain-containing protein, partial [Anaeromyxobacteraceae bacterium]|nr:PcfJ domain-containing protein [Anaeromyxobacteraceae bacterium]